MLAGRQARNPMTRALFRFYGTRDVVLGLGTLRAAAGAGEVAPWVAGGIASDVLDATVMVTEWATLPEGKRVPGVLAATAAAVAGAVVLARRLKR